MPGYLAHLQRDRAIAFDRMNELVAAARRGDEISDEEQREFDAAANLVRELDTKIAATPADSDLRPGEMSRAEAMEIVAICTEGGVPAMASSFIRDGVSPADARGRIGAAGQIRDMVAIAHRISPTLPADLHATMLAEGKTVEQARSAIFDTLVAAEEKTSVSSHFTSSAVEPMARRSMQAELRKIGKVPTT